MKRFAYFQTAADEALAMPVDDIDGIYINAATEVTITETRDFVQFIKTSIPGISKDVLADVVNVNVLDRKDIRDNMVKNAKELVTIFPKEVLDVVGLEWLGYKGGNRYLNNSEKVKNPNWKKGDPVEDKWLKNKDGSLVTGEQYNSFNETKNLAKTAEELGISLDFDPKDISIYNKY